MRYTHGMDGKGRSYKTRKRHERQTPGAAVGAIQRWRPWGLATGPKTARLRRKASRNAYKGGTRAMLRELARLLREQGEALKRIEARKNARDLGTHEERPHGVSRPAWRRQELMGHNPERAE